MAESYFQATNTVALLAWIALVLFPGSRAISGVLCAIVVPALLAVTYASIIVWKFTVNGPPPDDVMTIAGLRSVFADDWIFAAAWTHYLAFDMVVGAWMARDSVRHQIPWLLRTPSLVLTFLAGPLGFLVYATGRGILRKTVTAKETLSDQPRVPVSG